MAPLNISEEEEFEFRLRLEREQEQAKKPPAGEDAGFLQRAGFGGTPEQRTLFGLPKGAEETIFPRAADVTPSTPKQALQKSAAGATDFLSIPGRAVVSSPRLMPGGESFLEAFARTDAPEGSGPIAKLASGMVRSGSLPLSMLATGGTAPVARGVSGLLQMAGRGAISAIPEIVGGQTERFGETGEVSIGEALAEFATAGVLSGGGELLKGKAASMFRGAIKPKMVSRRHNFDPSVIINENLEGSFDTITKKATKRLREASQEASDVIFRKTADTPGATFRTDNVFTEFAEDANAGMFDDLFGAENVEEAIKLSKMLQGVLEKRGLDGELNLAQYQAVKKILGSGGAFSKSSAPDVSERAMKQVKKLLNLRVRDEIADAIPELIPLNKLEHNLLVVRDAVENAIEVSGNRNPTLSMRNFMLFMGGGASGGALFSDTPELALPLAVATVGAGAALDQGRGAGLVSQIGKGLQRGGGIVPGVTSIASGQAVQQIPKIDISRGTDVINPEEEEEKRQGRRQMMNAMSGVKWNSKGD